MWLTPILETFQMSVNKKIDKLLCTYNPTLLSNREEQSLDTGSNLGVIPETECW